MRCQVWRSTLPARRQLHIGRPHVIPLGMQALEIGEHHDRFDVGSYPSPSAYGSIEYLSQNHADVLASSAQGIRPRVLDVGSGTGAVGIACAALGADVVLTDRDALLQQIDSNIKLNHAIIEAAGGAARTLPLDWRTDKQLEALRPLAVPPFDLLIASDVIYPATSAIYRKLLHVLSSLPAVRVLLAYPYMRDRAPAGFFKQATGQGYGVQELHRNDKHVIAIVELFPPAQK